MRAGARVEASGYSMYETLPAGPRIMGPISKTLLADMQLISAPTFFNKLAALLLHSDSHLF